MNHYFIGKLLNPEDARKLVGKQKYLSKQINVTGKVFNFNTKFAYLGYLDQSTELQLKDKLFNIFEAITAQYGPQKAKYTKYSVTGLKTTKKSVSVLYENKNITDIIVPYIRSYTDEITDGPSDFLAHVALLRFDASDVGQIMKKNEKELTILNKTFMPEPNTFNIDSIDILRGVPKVRRSGAPSRYDDMDIEVVDKFVLRGNK